MKRRNIQCLFLFFALLTVATVVYAGGWAIVTLKDLPDYAVAGKPLTLRFAVRQHGVTLLSGLQPSVRATAAGGRNAKAAATPAGATGEYTAGLNLPEPGDWTITIDSGFNGNVVTLPLLKVIASESPVPAPFSPITKGLRLFAAKGCVGCHRHAEVNPERTTDARFDLTTRRFPQDYLSKFLADPSIKPAEMPNLNLRPEEIEALTAFITKVTKKEALRRDQ